MLISYSCTSTHSNDKPVLARVPSSCYYYICSHSQPPTFSCVGTTPSFGFVNYYDEPRHDFQFLCVTSFTFPGLASVKTKAGTNTPSDEYDTYREYRVANTNMYSRIHFFSEATLGNGLSVLLLVYACTMYSSQKFHFANLVYYRYCLFDIQV